MARRLPFPRRTEMYEKRRPCDFGANPSTQFRTIPKVASSMMCTPLAPTGLKVSGYDRAPSRSGRVSPGASSQMYKSELSFAGCSAGTTALGHKGLNAEASQLASVYTTQAEEIESRE